MTTSVSEPASTDPSSERVVALCQQLIRFGSVNPGDGTGPGERSAAEFVATVLDGVGASPRIVESAPTRANVLATIEGQDRSRPPLLVHGHLDVVPAHAPDWSVDPFAGEVRDDYLWGRGAVDMLDMDAIILASLERLKARGEKPARDVVLAFTADEEAGGVFGAHWMVDNMPDEFSHCSEAVGEVGGFSITVADQRLYLIETAEKGIAWMRLVANGTAGHGSLRNKDNAVVHLAEAVAAIGAHEWPTQLAPSVNGLLSEAAEILGMPFNPSGSDALEEAERIVESLGAIGKMIMPTLKNSSNPTMLDAGYKLNVIPGAATAHVDGRFLPGERDDFLATIDALIGPNVRRESYHDDIALETTFDGALVDAMTASLTNLDPGARVVSYMLSGGTDAKAFSQLGMRCFGFAPLRLPADLDFAALFHGVDERVPVDSLKFGVDVFTDFLKTC
jgi:acetylornithine deacetylase/succinyl-diaminopimelate desuccinylase-like protein